jgi:catechol 2,3-dioxygenase-like lactoylglutathione lyase family enzyme
MRRMMIDHISIRVSNYETSKKFYETVFAPLGFTLLHEFDFNGKIAGFGVKAEHGPVAQFWIAQHAAPHTGQHLAFASKDRAGVNAFYAAAIAAGAKDNGPPGVRAMYHPNYYGAFVFDPDGNNVEAVSHKPE